MTIKELKDLIEFVPDYVFVAVKTPNGYQDVISVTSHFSKEKGLTCIIPGDYTSIKNHSPIE